MEKLLFVLLRTDFAWMYPKKKMRRLRTHHL